MLRSFQKRNHEFSFIELPNPFMYLHQILKVNRLYKQEIYFYCLSAHINIQQISYYES